MYRVILSLNNNEPYAVIRRVDNAAIPFDDANRDYQEYKRWLEAGNTPEPWESETTVADIPVEDVIEDGD